MHEWQKGQFATDFRYPALSWTFSWIIDSINSNLNSMQIYLNVKKDFNLVIVNIAIHVVILVSDNASKNQTSFWFCFSSYLWQSWPSPSRGCRVDPEDSPWVTNTSTGLCCCSPCVTSKMILEYISSQKFILWLTLQKSHILSKRIEFWWNKS